MKAMILAAGLGTRLRPLTNDRPKALVEVAGRTLLEITLTRMSAFGVRDVIVNVHHFADLVVGYLKAHNNFGMHIEISREEELLDTGGGLKKAGWFLRDAEGRDEPFLLHNVDVISTIDLERMMNAHREKHALATLAAQERETSRYLLFNEELELCGRKAGRDSEAEIVRSSKNLQPLAFSGIHVISPRLLDKISEDGPFSIIASYLRLAGDGERIQGFRTDEYYWRDLGKLKDLKQAAEDFRQGIVS
ncbi:MAG TPA: nucleotidyltransferase family protein [Candidatus Acidoferrum sp.]|jgi:NDP-sugar pyrophosphorylase family protein